MRYTFARAYGLLGLILGVFSIISVIQHVFDVGLANYLSGILDFYRALLRPCFDLLYKPIEPILAHFSIHLPVWFSDVHALSIAGGGLWVRANNAAAEAMPEFSHVNRDYVGFTAKSMGLAFVGLGLVVILIALLVLPFVLLIAAKAAVDGGTLEQENPVYQLIFQLIAIVGAIFVFFLVNALSL